MYKLSIFIKTFIITIAFLIILNCTNGADKKQTNTSGIPASSGMIYLYGETHGIKSIQEKEIEIWGDYYKQGMRHFFLEFPYYSAEFINLWMNTEDDKILYQVYEDLKGSSAYNQLTIDFYKKIKDDYPETIFHGTDVGHQFNTTGKRYLNYLRQKGMEDSESYLLTLENIEQGKKYYNNRNGGYRENKMTENFIREFNKLKNKNIMGVYGSAHTDVNSMDYTNSVPSMANQLKKIYGNRLLSESLTYLGKLNLPLQIDNIEINNKNYEAEYYGRQSLKGFIDYEYREFWRLKNAYNDFKDAKKTGEILPYNNYPMIIKISQIFVIDYTKTDGTVIRTYYKSDGRVWQNQLSTEAFVID